MMIPIILGKLAQYESNVLKLYLDIYFVQEGGMGQGYTVTILFFSSQGHKNTFTRSLPTPPPMIMMGCF